MRHTTASSAGAWVAMESRRGEVATCWVRLPLCFPTFARPLADSLAHGDRHVEQESEGIELHVRAQHGSIGMHRGVGHRDP